MVHGQNEPDPPPPFIHVIASNVDAHTPLPSDGIIRVTFDRYLNALSVNRQGVTLTDEFGNIPGAPAIVTYDPVVRVVTIASAGGAWLQPGHFYKVTFPVSPPDASFFGLRAIDGATIDPSQPAIGFDVVAPTGNPPVEPKIDFCSDVFPLFAAARASTGAVHGLCSSSGCHASESTAQGLVLESPAGIRQTAISVQAEETTTSARSTPSPPSAAFPTGMPIIDPGNPGDSYLLYKLLLPDANGVPSARGTSFPYQACKPVTAPFDYGPAAAFASPDESQRLAAHVVGRRMPWGDWNAATSSFGQNGGTPLTLDEIERIRAWIAQGAQVDDCSPQCSGTAN